MSTTLKSLVAALCFSLIASFASAIPVQVEAASKTKASVSSVIPKKKPVVKTAPKATCVIKGNISSSKEKIYHVPGCPNYGQTVIDTSKGEMMFCTEADAKKAGWRKALNCP